MSGMFYNALMCSDSACNRILFVAEAVGFLGIPLAIGIWCCCNWAKWQAIEEERERRRERLINKTRVQIDPVDRAMPSYGTIHPLDVEEGNQREKRMPGSSLVDTVVQLHRSGEPTSQNMRTAADF